MKFRLSPVILSLALAVLAMPLGLSAQTQKPKPATYRVTDLGTLGGSNSFSYSINDSGMVAGGSNTSGQNDSVAQTGFLWYGGQPISLGTLGGSECPDCSSMGAAASASGSVAMLSETAIADPNGEDFCEFNVNRPTRTNHQCLAAVWRDGLFSALPTLPGGHNAEAFFANRQGEVVGVSETGVPDFTCATPFQVRRFEAVKWSLSGTPTPLAPLAGDTVSFAFMNNDAGESVGMSGLCSNVVLPPFAGPVAPHAVLWDAGGTPHDLTPSGAAGVLSVANSINSRGEVVLNSLMSDGIIHSFLWIQSAGAPQDLGTFPTGAVVTVVPCCNNINDRGQIVGFSVDAGGNLTALLWSSENAAPVDLNSLVPADSPWFLLTPGGISDAGEIATTAVNLNANTFEVHAVVLSPIAGIGPAARGAAKPPALPVGVRKLLQHRLHF